MRSRFESDSSSECRLRKLSRLDGQLNLNGAPPQTFSLLLDVSVPHRVAMDSNESEDYAVGVNMRYSGVSYHSNKRVTMLTLAWDIALDRPLTMAVLVG